MRCPNCKNRLLQKSGSQTRVRVQGAISFDANGLCKSKCYWCKGDVTVPIRLSEGVDVPAENYFIKTK